MFDNQRIGNDLTEFQDKKARRPISRVTLMLDSEKQLTAGDDTGIEIIANCPYATQAMVDNLLAKLRGMEYHPYSATAAALDPAAELGDGVEVGGIYSVLASVEDEGDRYPNIAAPGDEELDEEYPAVGPLEQTVNRQIAETRSEIKKTSEEITLRVDGLNGEFAELKTTVDGVTITDSSGTTRIKGSSIDTGSLKANSISADAVNLTGAIKFGDLEPALGSDLQDAYNWADESYSAVDSWKYEYNGTTYIDGTQLMTGTVTASSLRGGEVQILDGDGNAQAIITPGYNDGGVLAMELRSYTGLRLISNGGNVYIASELTGGGITIGNRSVNCYPSLLQNGVNVQTVSSDRRRKQDIDYDFSRYEAFFKALRPVSYEYKETPETVHMGFVAQDVEQALREAGEDPEKYGMVDRFIRTGPDGTAPEGAEQELGLRYSEFAALCVHMIQKQGEEIRDLQKKIKELEKGE